jgi:hypothetical protein
MSKENIRMNKNSIGSRSDLDKVYFEPPSIMKVIESQTAAMSLDLQQSQRKIKDLHSENSNLQDKVNFIQLNFFQIWIFYCVGNPAECWNRQAQLFAGRGHADEKGGSKQWAWGGRDYQAQVPAQRFYFYYNWRQEFFKTAFSLISRERCSKARSNEKGRAGLSKIGYTEKGVGRRGQSGLCLEEKSWWSEGETCWVRGQICQVLQRESRAERPTSAAAQKPLLQLQRQSSHREKETDASKCWTKWLESSLRKMIMVLTPITILVPILSFCFSERKLMNELKKLNEIITKSKMTRSTSVCSHKRPSIHEEETVPKTLLTHQSTKVMELEVNILISKDFLNQPIIYSLLDPIDQIEGRERPVWEQV